MYACKAMAYRKALRVGGTKTQAPVSILDAGSGQGFFAQLVQSDFKSPDYTGVDISEKAIAYGARKFPNFHWFCADFSADLPEDRLYDIVQSIEVLHLIIDDSNHSSAVANLSACLKSGGLFILTDTLPAERCCPNSYICFRPESYYRQIFGRLGLEMLAVFDTYYWIPDVGQGKGSLHRVLRRLPTWFCYALDRIFLALGLPKIDASHDSCMKMIVCRKR